MNLNKSASLFSAKLLMLYIASYCLIPTIFFLLDFGNLEETEACWNSDLELSLILCLPLLSAVLFAVWHFRKMPVIASAVILIGLFHIGSTLRWYFSENGFVQSFEPASINFAGLIVTALIWAIPFATVYLTWRFWPRRQAEGLPAL